MKRATWALVLLALSGCATTSPGSGEPGRTLQVVAAENVWGSLVSQLGGSHVRVTSIIDSPGADPHDYEPTAADGRRVATADLVIANGIGYDRWAARMMAANPRPTRADLTVGEVVGVPSGGNPHRWYSPADVRTVIDAMTAALSKLDPSAATYFDAQRTQLLTVRMKAYFAAIDAIRSRYAGTPVGASESVFAPLADALGLKLLTPAGFLSAVSQGTDPTPADKSTIDRQIRDHRVQVYVYNSQNATPDVQEQLRAARTAGVAVAAVTETLAPAGASFQDWQVGQLTRLQQALARTTGP